MTHGAPAPRDERAADSPPGLPRWVAMLGLGALAVAVVLVAVMLLVGGGHGPGMHGG